MQILAKKDEEKVQQELQEIYFKVHQISDGVAVADDIVKEGNDKLKNFILQKTSTQKELQRAQSKIETDMKKNTGAK